MDYLLVSMIIILIKNSWNWGRRSANRNCTRPAESIGIGVRISGNRNWSSEAQSKAGRPSEETAETDEQLTKSQRSTTNHTRVAKGRVAPIVTALTATKKENLSLNKRITGTWFGHRRFSTICFIAEARIAALDDANVAREVLGVFP